MKHLRILLNVSASVSKWLSVLLKEVSSTLEVISVKDVLQMLNLLVMQIPPNERVSYNLDYITKSLIELLIECCTKAGGSITVLVMSSLGITVKINIQLIICFQ